MSALSSNILSVWQRVSKMFTKQVSIAPLVTFRIVFGILMFAGTLRFMLLGWIEDHYTSPKIHFKYYGFEWIEPLPLEWMYIVHILLLLASLFVALGLFYRIAATLIFLCFTYTELIDLTYYLNHYYFVSLVSFMMILVPANRCFSIDVFRKPSLYCNTAPAWCINIFRLQLAIVYIYAGVMKINYDWLINALPLKIWLPANDNIPVLGWLFAWEYTPLLFSWAGMLYDTTIVFWLLWPKTRLWAYATVIFFHAVTGILFQIGVFPIVMIGATLIFFSDEWHHRLHLLIAKYLSPKQLAFLNNLNNHPYILNKPLNSLVKIFFTIYFIFQLLFPWRHLLYPGNMFWSEEGYRYGWRVMLMEKAGTATFYVKDSDTGREGQVFNCDFLNIHQEKQMAMQPDMILQYAHFLGKYYEQQGVYKPKVRAEVYVTLNARPSKLYIDSTVDLMKIKDGWKYKWWINKYEN
jgi:uncharacterized membrane protein YphA (DoxX/SURF4 family)